MILLYEYYPISVADFSVKSINLVIHNMCFVFQMRFFNWRDIFWSYLEEQHLFSVTELILKQCLNSKVLHGASESTSRPGL